MKNFWATIKPIFLLFGEKRYKTVRLNIINTLSYLGFSNSQNRKDRQIIGFFKHKKNGICMEVGGADGIDQSDTLYLDRKYRWKTYIVEPVLHQFQLCEKFRKKAKVDRYAFVSNESFKTIKNIDIEVDDLNSKVVQFHKSMPDSAKNIQSAPTNTLDNYFKKNNIASIDILILDVESYETEVLDGYIADTSIIKYLLVETWDFRKFDSYASKRGWKFIKKFGNDFLYALNEKNIKRTK